MLFDGLDRFGQNKTKTAYKKEQQRLSYLGFAASLLFLLLAFSLKLSAFAVGFLIGLAIGLFLAAFGNLRKVRNDQALTKNYIAHYDERNRYLNSLTMTYLVGLLFVFIAVMLSLYAFWNIELAYVTTLVLILYLIILGGVGIRFILNKLL